MKTKTEVRVAGLLSLFSACMTAAGINSWRISWTGRVFVFEFCGTPAGGGINWELEEKTGILAAVPARV